MKISFHGACREVTGSCIHIESRFANFLVDCGMFQGGSLVEDRNSLPFGFDVKKLDFVLLTHAHLDHCGRLPKLFKDGFAGKIYCSEATRDLCELMLLDSARIITREAREKNVEPLYREDDVLGLMELFVPVEYNTEIKIAKNLEIQLRDAGHILGSAIFEVWVKELMKVKKLVFSGDLGNTSPLILREAESITGADLLFTESTYAGNVHESKEEGRRAIRKAIKASVGNHGTLIIPIFALEKCQEILYELNYLVENGEVPKVPIFLDSPLAIKTVDVYRRYFKLYNKRSLSLLELDGDLFDFPGLTYTETKEESKQINQVLPPKVILAGSGMCNGGRIPYHLKLNLENDRTQLLIVSFQVEGSLGRQLLSGAKRVIIDGTPVHVNAKVSVVNSYSSHADENFLENWIKKIKAPKPQKVFIVHGELKANNYLQEKLKANGLKAQIPEYGKSYRF